MKEDGQVMFKHILEMEPRSISRVQMEHAREKSLSPNVCLNIDYQIIFKITCAVKRHLAYILEHNLKMRKLHQTNVRQLKLQNNPDMQCENFQS